MKKFSLVLVMLLFVVGMTYAQERGAGQRPSSAQQGGGQGRPQMNPEEMLKRQTESMVEELKLNKDQETKVSAINKKYLDKQSAYRTKMQGASDEDRAKFREEFTKMQTEKDKEIKGILTADQVKLYDELIKKRAEQMRNRPGGGGGGPR